MTQDATSPSRLPPVLFRAPAGTILAMAGIGAAPLLATRKSVRQSVTMTLVVALPTAQWLWRRG